MTEHIERLGTIEPDTPRASHSLKIEDGVAALLISVLFGTFLAKVLLFSGWAYFGDAPGFLDERLRLVSELPGAIVEIALLLALVGWKAPGKLRIGDATGIGITRAPPTWRQDTAIAFGIVAAVVTLTSAIALWSGSGPSAGVARSALASVAGLERAMLVAAFVLVGPVAEELAFRGVIFAAIAARFGATTAIVLTTLIFTAVHIPSFGSVALVGIAGLGLATAILRVRTGSLLPAIVFHIAWNAVAVLVSVAARVW